MNGWISGPCVNWLFDRICGRKFHIFSRHSGSWNRVKTNGLKSEKRDYISWREWEREKIFCTENQIPILSKESCTAGIHLLKALFCWYTKYLAKEIEAKRNIKREIFVCVCVCVWVSVKERYVGKPHLENNYEGLSSATADNHSRTALKFNLSLSYK